MKKTRRVCLLLLCMLFINSVFSVPWSALAASVGGAESCIGLDASRSLAAETQLLPTAKAVVLFALDYNTMVYNWNPDEKLDPSGMNKIMTALLALEEGNPDRLVEITAKALSSVASDARKAGLTNGEKMPLRDLLYLMMVGSANDAAAVIAEHIAGDQSAFVARMNQRAAELGCTNTTFLNATGLSVEGQQTTARDLAKITAQALTMETFVEIFSAREYTVAGTSDQEQRQIETTNYMMSDRSVKGYLDTRITGGKTGAFSSRDRSFISTSEKDGVRYLSVVMSAQVGAGVDTASPRAYVNFVETQLLLDHAYAQFSVRQLLASDRVMEQFSVLNGENDLAASPKESVTTLLPNDVTADKLDYKFSQRDGDISAPVSAGEVVGSVEIWYDGICVVSSDLVSMHAVREKGKTSAVLPPKEKGNVGIWRDIGQVLLVIFGGIVVLMIIVPVSMRLISIRRYRKKRHRRTQRRR